MADQQPTDTRPLAGIKVLDFTHGVAGPFCTMLMGDMGADVVKIEHPRRGDNTRYMNVSRRFKSDIPRAGGDYFMAINRNKRSLTLDLKSERGREIARSLAGWADIAVSNFRPGVMERLGVSYADLSAVNPGIIYASLSAYGERGALAHQPGMDIAVQARSGVMSITGYPDMDVPVKPGVSLADFSGGAHLLIAIQSALFHRERTGMGQSLSVSLLDATMAMLINYSVAVIDGGAEIARMGSGHPQLVPFQAFSTKDGAIVISPGTNKLFRELCQLIERPDLAENPLYASNPDRVENRGSLVPILAEILMAKTTEEWTTLFEAHEMPCAPVNNLSQAFSQQQLIDNDMIVEMQHPTAGTLHSVGVPYKFSATPCSTLNPPPIMGADSRKFLAEALQMPDAHFNQLVEAGIVSDGQAGA